MIDRVLTISFVFILISCGGPDVTERFGSGSYFALNGSKPEGLSLVAELSWSSRVCTYESVSGTKKAARRKYSEIPVAQGATAFSIDIPNELLAGDDCDWNLSFVQLKGVGAESKKFELAKLFLNADKSPAQPLNINIRTECYRHEKSKRYVCDKLTSFGDGRSTQAPILTLNAASYADIHSAFIEIVLE